MSEILTESFCERCGTRYTFESARPKIRLKGVKVLSRGLKNFVLSDDTTMDEAMAAARSEADREVTAHQLDAFHKTFNFCMSCRQYTCPNCWNEVEARCQSCAPLALPEIAPATFPSLMTLADATVLAEPAANGANGHDVAAVEAAAAEEAKTSVGEPEAIAAEAVAEEVVVEPAAKATSQTAGLLHRFRPGQSLDDELAAFERERSDAGAQLAEPQADEVATPSAIEEPFEAAAAEPEPEPEPAAAEPAAVMAAEAEPAAAEPAAVVATEAEAAAAEPAAVVAAQAEPEPAAPPAADVVEQPTWRITAPDTESPAIGAPAPADTAIPVQANGAPLPTSEPNWPAKPEWPAPQASVGLPFLGRPIQPQGGVDSLWAASNRELVATPPAPGRSTSGIQPCISCGLSLSATARFCRRCGTLQGG
jgi:hypothetical protein